MDEQDRPLRRSDLDPEPLRQFERWLGEARAVVRTPDAMALATAGAGGSPSVRMVLLKQADAAGLVFYTHGSSRKGRELDANPQAALLFYWDPLGRQVRVEGPVERVPPVGLLCRHQDPEPGGDVGVQRGSELPAHLAVGDLAGRHGG